MVKKKQNIEEEYKCMNCGKIWKDKAGSYSKEAQKRLCCCYKCSEHLTKIGGKWFFSSQP